MKKILCSLFVISMFFAQSAYAENFADVLRLAMKGDYQAQRNVAYGYVAFPYKDQDMNPILGCAWYWVILKSGSPKIHQGDVGNVKVYCGKLDPISLDAAQNQARELYRKIYKRAPNF